MKHIGDEVATDPGRHAPVDAVVTWVDGSDPAHAARRQAELARLRAFRITAMPGAKSETRFADSGEIGFCLRGIRRHCPWIRTIFLVTDRQVPAFLREGGADALGVRIVDHAEIFRGHEWALPSFNSRAIETAVHRIEGLAERVVYFNDDVIVVGQTGIEQFFSEDDKVVLRGAWKPLPRFGTLRVWISSLLNHLAYRLSGTVRSMAVCAQYRAAQLAGFRGRYFQAPHTPHPLHRSVLAGFFDAHPQVFERNIGYRFRDMDQFVPIPLANHLEIRAGHHVESAGGDYLLICFNRDALPAIRAKIDLLEAGRHRFLCLQGFERAAPAERDRIVAFLEQRMAGEGGG